MASQCNDFRSCSSFKLSATSVSQHDYNSETKDVVTNNKKNNLNSHRDYVRICLTKKFSLPLTLVITFLLCSLIALKARSSICMLSCCSYLILKCCNLFSLFIFVYIFVLCVPRESFQGLHHHPLIGSGILGCHHHIDEISIMCFRNYEDRMMIIIIIIIIPYTPCFHLHLHQSFREY